MHWHFGAIILSVSDSRKSIFKIVRSSGQVFWKNSALSKTFSEGNRFSSLLCTQCFLLGRLWTMGPVGCCSLYQSLMENIVHFVWEKGSGKEGGKSLQLPCLFFFLSILFLVPMYSSSDTVLASLAQFQPEINSGSELELENTITEECGLGTVLGRGGLRLCSQQSWSPWCWSRGMSHPCVLITALAKLSAGENSIAIESFVNFSSRIFHMFDATPLIILCKVNALAFPWSAAILYLVFFQLVVNMCVGVCICMQFTIISSYYIRTIFPPIPNLGFTLSGVLFW